MDAQTARDLDSGLWAHPNPSRCPCQGNGWILSDYDTWHPCHLHGKDVPHPEMGEEYFAPGTSYDFDGHLRTMQVNAYKLFREDARRLGFKGHFKNACKARLETSEPTGADWTDAAYEIYDITMADHEDGVARAHGYSCGLEMSFAGDAHNRAH